MWPVDYILNSIYSPLRLEQDVPNHQWRDAFEDLLALECNGEMVSPESRKKEAETAVKILYGKASHIIYRVNQNLRQLARLQTELQESRERALLNGDMTRVSRIGNETLPLVRSCMEGEIRKSRVVKEAVEAQKDFPASRLKQRGQWIASLISSGALPGWTSHLESGPTPGQQRMLIRERTDPSNGPDDQNRIVCTENALEQIFGQGKISERADSSVEIDLFGLRSNEVLRITKSEGEGWSIYHSEVNPPRRHVTNQSTTSERVLLPDGSKVNKVVLTSHSVNGKKEKTVIIQDACKVLEEVEKARMLMQDEGTHWWSEYR